MDATEPECNEQREARDLLEKMEEERTRLKEMQKLGKAPPVDHPTQASIEKLLDNQMQWLKTEVLRPASQRLPKNEVPPREVLSAAMNVSLYEPIPPASGYSLRLVRFVHIKSGGMFLGFSLTTPGTTDGESQTANVASMPWKKNFGAWPAKNWAFLMAAVIRRFGWLPMRGLLISYKVQDVPMIDFEKHVYNAYVDIVRGDRYNQSTDVLSLSQLFADSLNVDRMNDLALAFDTRLWRVAYDLGIQVDDYSSRPGLTFMLGDDDIVIDGSSTRKRWDSVKEYIYARLDGATIHSDLDEEDAEKHKKFLWEVLKTQQIKEMRHDDKSVVETWSIYSEYAERKLGKKLRKIAKSFDMVIPSLATEKVTTRCDYCNKPEGEVVDDYGQKGSKLVTCSCNPNGRPYYCNAQCQKLDWPIHKEFCTYIHMVEKKEKKKNKVEGGINDSINSKKKKKDKKKKKK
ncbi:hypothetical protein ACHAWC_001847 [Mediolabrus comicus]